MKIASAFLSEEEDVTDGRLVGVGITSVSASSYPAPLRNPLVLIVVLETADIDKEFEIYVGMPMLSDEETNLIMHIELPILGGHVLVATDLLESQGHQLRVGNNMTINLELEERAETDRLFRLLSDGGSDLFELQDMPWGAYWGTCADRFGVRWMFNCVDPTV
jgi:PhnB protein